MSRMNKIAWIFLFACGSSDDPRTEALERLQASVPWMFSENGQSVHLVAGTLPGEVIGHWDGAGTVTMDLDKDSSCPVAVLAHELGHAMGLTHDPDPSRLMFHAAPCLSLAAIAEDLKNACHGYCPTLKVEIEQ